MDCLRILAYLFAVSTLIQIIPSGEEMIPAVIHFANALYNKPLKK